MLRQITYKGKSGSQQRYSSSDTEQVDSYLPLEYLIEPEDGNEAGAGRLTNYVWALNVTTDPVSLWLVYDYVSQDDLGYDMVIDLDKIYLNPRNVRNSCPYTYEQVDSPYFGLEEHWNMLKVLDNLDDWALRILAHSSLNHPTVWQKIWGHLLELIHFWSVLARLMDSKPWPIKWYIMRSC